MRKTAAICFFSIVLLALCVLPAPARAQGTTAREPDSEYVEKKPAPKPRGGGGLFDFLPFVGSRPRKVEPEKLEPAPPPEESRPVLFKNEVEQLRGVAERWVLTSEFTEPTVRQEEGGGYYRDYVVFADEYQAKVLRGDKEDIPFIGHIYIKGDYFRTGAHGTAEEARADFKFNYQTREFRVIFDRVEKWEYSDNPAEEPFAFVERWEYSGLQSRPVAPLTRDVPAPSPPAEEEKARPEPAGE